MLIVSQFTPSGVNMLPPSRAWKRANCRLAKGVQLLPRSDSQRQRKNFALHCPAPFFLAHTLLFLGVGQALRAPRTVRFILPSCSRLCLRSIFLSHQFLLCANHASLIFGETERETHPGAMQSSALEAKDRLRRMLSSGRRSSVTGTTASSSSTRGECESDRQDTGLTAVVCSWAASPCSHREMKLGDQISLC